MYYHRAVLLKEVIEYLNPKKNQNFIDCTLGGGEHTLAIFKKTKPRGKILGIDLDKRSLKEVEKKAKDQKIKSERLILVQDNFKNLETIIEKYFSNIPVHGVLLDLGLSSALIEMSERGFSFQKDEPLDMRFDVKQKTKALNIIGGWAEKDLVRIFREYGEERYAKNIAHRICKERKSREIRTTGQLVKLIKQSVPFNKAKHPATRVFQALRIAVNQELESLKKVLPQAIKILEPGGRLAVISFHSLEDRIVKKFFVRESKNCICPPEFPVCRCGHRSILKIITKKAIIPTEEEIRANPRARSARLRVAEKIPRRTRSDATL